MAPTMCSVVWLPFSSRLEMVVLLKFWYWLMEVSSVYPLKCEDFELKWVVSRSEFRVWLLWFSWIFKKWTLLAKGATSECCNKRSIAKAQCKEFQSFSNLFSLGKLILAALLFHRTLAVSLSDQQNHREPLWTISEQCHPTRYLDHQPDYSSPFWTVVSLLRDHCSQTGHFWPSSN